MRTLSFIFFLFSCLFANAQAPGIEWEKSFGGTETDGAYSIQQTRDGGYIIAGTTNSTDGDVTGIHGVYSDFWIVKLNSNGNIEWQKCLGGYSQEGGLSIQQTGDAGYIIAGISYSEDDGDVTGHHDDPYYITNADFWIVKLSSTGTIEWQKCLGGGNHDYANSVQQTADGGYIVAGTVSSNDGDVTGNHGWVDSWVVKLSSTGTMEWQKCLGGSSREFAQSVRQTEDGGYIVAGESMSTDGDVTGNHGVSDAWIVKLSSTGNIEWQKCLGGSNNEWAESVQQTADGGYIAAGGSSSNDGDVTGNHGGWGDFWIVKLSSTGIIEWQKCLGGSNYEWAESVQQTEDGGYIVAGYSSSADGNVTGNHGGYDFWIVKLSSTGNIEWQKCLGGSNAEWAQSIQQTSDGGYITAGVSSSDDGDITGHHGTASFNNSDFWIVKLAPTKKDVWMRDTWNDTGLEPDPATAAENMWSSPDIWVRNTQDVGLLHQHEHENPISLQTNWMYVKLHNKSALATRGQLEVYITDATTGIGWPNGWQLVTSIPVTNFAGSSEKVLEYQWTPRFLRNTNYCMLARWVAATDPMTTPETADIEANVRANNNIIWHNLNIIDPNGTGTFTVRNPFKECVMVSLAVRPRLGDVKSFMQYGGVSVRLNKTLQSAWKEGGSKGTGFTKGRKGYFTINDPGASFDNIPLQPGDSATVNIRFERLPQTIKDIFFIDVTQFTVNTCADVRNGILPVPKIIGGVSYEIHTGAGKSKPIK